MISIGYLAFNSIECIGTIPMFASLIVDRQTKEEPPAIVLPKVMRMTGDETNVIIERMSPLVKVALI